MMSTHGDALRDRYGMTGILTLAPEQGGITELLCDMDECYCPRGRAYFKRTPDPMPEQIPDWIPSEEHFPRSQEAGGRRDPGNVRLAHRRCNSDDWGTGSGHERKRQRARDDKEKWPQDHPEEAAATAKACADAEERWAASRRATNVPHLEQVTAHVMSVDGALVGPGFWLYVWRIHAGSETALYVGWAGDSSSPHCSFPLAGGGRPLERPLPQGVWTSRQLQAMGIDPTICIHQVVAIGPIFPPQLETGHPVRFGDEMDAQETALAGLLCTRGYRVIGTQPAPRVYDRGLFERVRAFIEPEFPRVSSLPWDVSAG